jgi:hypothetical protein
MRRHCLNDGAAAVTSVTLQETPRKPPFFAPSQAGPDDDTALLPAGFVGAPASGRRFAAGLGGKKISPGRPSLVGR